MPLMSGDYPMGDSLADLLAAVAAKESSYRPTISTPVNFVDKLNQGMGFGTSLLLTFYQGQEAVNTAKARAAAANYSAVPTYAAQAPAPDELGKYIPLLAGAGALGLVALLINNASAGARSYAPRERSRR